MNEHQTLMMEYYELWGKMDDVYDHWAKARGISYTELLFRIIEVGRKYPTRYRNR